jgi:hypothetical protein
VAADAMNCPNTLLEMAYYIVKNDDEMRHALTQHALDVERNRREVQKVTNG